MISKTKDFISNLINLRPPMWVGEIFIKTRFKQIKKPLTEVKSYCYYKVEEMISNRLVRYNFPVKYKIRKETLLERLFNI